MPKGNGSILNDYRDEISNFFKFFKSFPNFFLNFFTIDMSIPDERAQSFAREICVCNKKPKIDNQKKMPSFFLVPFIRTFFYLESDFWIRPHLKISFLPLVMSVKYLAQESALCE